MRFTQLTWASRASVEKGVKPSFVLLLRSLSATHNFMLGVSWGLLLTYGENFVATAGHLGC